MEYDALYEFQPSLFRYLFLVYTTVPLAVIKDLIST